MAHNSSRARKKEFLRRAIKIEEAVRHQKSNSLRLSDFEIYVAKMRKEDALLERKIQAALK